MLGRSSCRWRPYLQPLTTEIVLRGFAGGDMLERRILLLGCCAAASCNSKASAQTARFICGTVDRLPSTDSAFEVERYSAEADFSTVRLHAIINEFKLTPYGTAQF